MPGFCSFTPMSIRDRFPVDKWTFSTDTIFAGLTEEEQAILKAHQTSRVYEKGEIIFREGAIPSGIYYINRGKVKKYREDPEGNRQIIYVANTGEWVGYHAVLSDERYPDSAAALEKSSLSFIPRQDFLALLEQSKTFNNRLLRALSHEFTVLVNNVTLHARRPVRQRLALQLVLLREKYKDTQKAGAPVEISLSQEDLANLAGTTREHIARVLTVFKEQGIINTKNRKIIVLDVHRLIDISKD